MYDPTRQPILSKIPGLPKEAENTSLTSFHSLLPFLVRSKAWSSVHGCEDMSMKFIHDKLLIGKRTLMGGGTFGLRRRKIVPVSLLTAIAAIIIGILMLGQTTPQAPIAETPSPSDIKIPENLFVVPEVPYGTIAMLLAMLSALLVAQKISRKKLLQT